MASIFTLNEYPTKETMTLLLGRRAVEEKAAAEAILGCG
jgi:hypothetical protein